MILFDGILASVKRFGVLDLHHFIKWNEKGENVLKPISIGSVLL